MLGKKRFASGGSCSAMSPQRQALLRLQPGAGYKPCCASASGCPQNRFAYSKTSHGRQAIRAQVSPRCPQRQRVLFHASPGQGFLCHLQSASVLVCTRIFSRRVNYLVPRCMLTFIAIDFCDSTRFKSRKVSVWRPQRQTDSPSGQFIRTQFFGPTIWWRLQIKFARNVVLRIVRQSSAMQRLG